MFSSSPKAAGVSPPSRSSLCRFAAGAIIGLVRVLGFALPVAAQSEAPPSAVSSLEPKAPLANFNGAYRESIKIEVPAFRGLEPDLTLSYSSARTGLYPGQPASGWLGVGWTLSGIDVIERAVRGRGSPSFNDQDIFLLDGEEMIACGTGVISPSCASGGTHATRVESYRRIKRDALGNTWEVTDRDGTRHVYRPVGEGQTVGSDPNEVKLAFEYRWLLRSSTDSHGNQVAYNWSCGVLPDCHLKTITYSQTSIHFHWAVRPDRITYATGVNVSTLGHRLYTVDIMVNSERVRAYGFSYDTSVSTNRSRLITVQQFGKDAAVNEIGDITAGTKLPKITLEYSGSNVRFSVGTKLERDRYFPSYFASEPFTSDLNGDQRDDFHSSLHSTEQDGCQAGVHLSNSGGTLSEAALWSAGGCDYDETYSSDLNRDGNSDLIGFKNAGTRTWVDSDNVEHTEPYNASIRTFRPTISSNGRGDFAQKSSTEIAYNDLDQVQMLVGDFDGDGNGEFGYIARYRNRNEQKFFYELNNVLTSRPTSWTIPLSNNDKTVARNLDKIFTGDVNGDGKSDIISINFLNHSQSDISIYFSTGSGFSSPMVSSFAIRRYPAKSLRWGSFDNFLVENWTVADANGDGRVDLIRAGAIEGDSAGVVNPTADSLPLEVYISTGSSFQQQTWTNVHIRKMMNERGNYEGAMGFFVIPGDYNADGRIDLLIGDYHEQNRLPLRALISTGSSFYLESGLTMSPSRGWSGDFNGDGRSDLVLSSDFSGMVHYATDLQPDLLTSLRNTGGGDTILSYSPSSRWQNNRLPFVVQTSSSVTKADGRGQFSETKFAYKGGLWNAVERQFLGFKASHVTLPCIQGETSCPSVDITFSQNLASLGRAEKVEYKDGTGNLLRSIVHKYEVNNTTAPFTALNTGSTVTDFARMLPGDGGNPDPDPVPVITASFQGATALDSDYNENEAKTVNLGTPAPDRMIVVGVAYQDNTRFGALYLGEPGTWGRPGTGIPLTRRMSITNPGRSPAVQLEIWTGIIPEGTSNTLYFSGSQDDVGNFIAGVFAVYGTASEVPVATTQAVGTAGTVLSSSIDYPLGGLVLGFARSWDTSNVWSGLVQHREGGFTAASKIATYPGTAPLTLTTGDGDLKTLLAVSFAPRAATPQQVSGQ